MSNLNDFNREAKAALRVALQWLLLAVPTGLVCGVVGTAFHLSVEYVTELRAAQSWLLLCLPLAGLAIVALYKVTKCEGVGTNNVIRAVQSGEPKVSRSINWVRVAQRFPVKIMVEKPDPEMFRIGASAVANLEPQ